MKYNFRKASADRDENGQALAALQDAIVDTMKKDGIGGIERSDFRMKAGRLIRQVVTDTFSMTDPTPIFTERRTAELGDKLEFTKLINTLRVVRYAPQSHPLAFTPRKAKYTITTKAHELAFTLPLQKIMTRQHQVSEFTDMAAQALTRHYIELTLTAIDAAAAAGNVDMQGRPLRTNVTGPDVTKEAIDGALRRMGQYNSGVTIFGSRYALHPLFEFGAQEAGDPTKEEFQARGVLGVYRGARLVAVEDEYNPYYGEFTSINGRPLEDLLWIAGDQPGAVLLERDLSPLDWELVDTRIAQFGTGIRMDHGIMVHEPHRYHVIQLNA